MKDTKENKDHLWFIVSHKKVLYQICQELLNIKELVPQVFSPINLSVEREKKDSLHQTPQVPGDGHGGKSYLLPAVCQMSQGPPAAACVASSTQCIKARCLTAARDEAFSSAFQGPSQRD